MKRQDDAPEWMWANALAALDRAERVHRQLFRPPAGQGRSWEPPVDVLESPHEVLIYVALPGVAARDVHTAIEGGTLTVSGRRPPPSELGSSIIHRLELPRGRFERRIRLPPGQYAGVSIGTERGCLVIRLQKR
ncbi:Hsp20/alpha crystallin family protein [Dokdonella sp.]|uniref:Hsp20/alpha crystallin family protein n=1 Tax=Dokdonella sp. TaxID=2291710 RepID=UPI0031C0980D|nr:Hsp20/alpha crystallin family protein [Dokdonella sp.]